MEGGSKICPPTPSWMVLSRDPSMDVATQNWTQKYLTKTCNNSCSSPAEPLPTQVEGLLWAHEKHYQFGAAICNATPHCQITADATHAGSNSFWSSAPAGFGAGSTPWVPALSCCDQRRGEMARAGVTGPWRGAGCRASPPARSLREEAGSAA